MGYFQDALAKVGLAQPGPKITSQDRAILEQVQVPSPIPPTSSHVQVLTFPVSNYKEIK